MNEKTKEHIKKLNQVINVFGSSKPEEYSKHELYEKQKKLNTMMHYALVITDADLLEACYLLAYKFKIEFGYAQDIKGYPLKEKQNTDPSVARVIAELRGKP